MDNRERNWPASDLALLLSNPEVRDYRVLLCADSVLLPSPWTDKFRVEIDHVHRVVRLSGDLT